MRYIALCAFVTALLAGQASAGLIGTTAYMYTTDASGTELFWDGANWVYQENKGDPVGQDVQVESAVFSSTNLQSTGTGVIQPFLKMQAGGSTTIESGYNTDVKTQMLDDQPAWTYSLQLGWLADVTAPITGVDSKQFLLDINQVGKQPPYLQLTDLRIYVGAGLANYALSNPAVWVPPAATEVYSLVTATKNYTVQMDYRLDPGSGGGDMWVYIPSSVFAGFDSTDNVLLYSAFAQNNDGPEEWAVTTGPEVVIPLPGAVLLGFLGLGAAGLKLRRFV